MPSGNSKDAAHDSEEDLAAGVSYGWLYGWLYDWLCAGVWTAIESLRGGDTAGTRSFQAGRRT